MRLSLRRLVSFGAVGAVVFTLMSVGTAASASAVPQGSVVTPGQHVSATRPSATASQYGALSFSPEDRTGDSSFGYAFGNSQDTVIYNAALDCYRKLQAPDCQTLVWVNHGYATLDRASNGAYSSGWGATSDQSDANALQICQDQGGQDCHWIVRLNTANPSPAARGGGAGRVCFILDPSGAPPFGHNGWAYRANNRGSNPWIFGATEGTRKPPYYVPPGPNAAKEAHSWSQSSDWDGLKNTFMNGPDVLKGEYTIYRCRDTVAANPDAAMEEWNKQAAMGYGVNYNPADNNCLTHAVATLRAYGASDLPDGAYSPPNSYIEQALTHHHFLPIAYL
jgi:hypothetical protein